MTSLASLNRSANTGFLAALLAGSIILTITYYAARSVAPLVV